MSEFLHRPIVYFWRLWDFSFPAVIYRLGFSTCAWLKWRKTNSKFKHPDIHVCSSWAEWAACERSFLAAVKSSKIIGLDCEWVTVDNERHPIALLQLAPTPHLCYLIRLCNIQHEDIPKTLTQVLADTNILKVGVNIVGDAEKLCLDYGWHVKGCLDLRFVVQRNPEFKDIWNRGLRALAGKILNVDIKKSIEISCGNWEAEILDSDQITYATGDAIVAIQIFEKLYPNYKRKTFAWVPFQKHSDLRAEEFKEIVDVPYKSYNHNGTENKKSIVRPLCKSKTEKVLARAKKNRDFDNCILVAPDGEPLCTCDKGKANWYLEKELGELVREDPYIVRLTFEPSGRPILDNKYYIQEKKSGCVVCGNNDHTFSKTVVPHEYRRFFPKLMKKNLSHDVVLLCVSCHRLSNVLDRDLRNQLAQECDAPIGCGEDIKQQEDSKLCRIKSAARALLKAMYSIPLERRQMLEGIVLEHCGVTKLSNEILMEIANMSTVISNDNYIPHGLKVYQHMCKNGGLIAFETRWRKHFLDTMNPQFLPTMWSVDHNHERLALQVSEREMDFDVSILGISQEMFDKVRKMKAL